jgi:hypothetical protein
MAALPMVHDFPLQAVTPRCIIAVITIVLCKHACMQFSRDYWPQFQQVSTRLRTVPRETRPRGVGIRVCERNQASTGWSLVNVICDYRPVEAPCSSSSECSDHKLQLAFAVCASQQAVVVHVHATPGQSL